MNDFPLNLQHALKELSLEYKITLLKETHYEALNRELQWFQKDKLYRIDFNFDTVKQIITVTQYIEEYPSIVSKILVWWNNHIRLFPYRVKIKWNQLYDLPIELSKDEYKKKIEYFLRELTHDKK